MRGTELLRHFLFSVAGVPADWKMEDVLQEERAKIADMVNYLLTVCLWIQSQPSKHPPDDIAWGVCFGRARQHCRQGCS